MVENFGPAKPGFRSEFAPILFNKYKTKKKLRKGTLSQWQPPAEAATYRC